MADAENTGQKTSGANPYAHLSPWELSHQLYAIAYQVKALTLMFYEACPDYESSDHGTGVNYLLGGVAKQLDLLAEELGEVDYSKAAAIHMEAAAAVARASMPSSAHNALT